MLEALVNPVRGDLLADFLPLGTIASRKLNLGVKTILPKNEPLLVLAGSVLQEFPTAIEPDSSQQILQHLLCVPQHRFLEPRREFPRYNATGPFWGVRAFHAEATENGAAIHMLGIGGGFGVEEKFYASIDGSDCDGARIVTAGHRCDRDGCAQNITEQESTAMPFLTHLILRAVRH